MPILLVLSQSLLASRNRYSPSQRMIRRFRVRFFGTPPSCNGGDIVKFRRMSSKPLILLMRLVWKCTGFSGAEKICWEIDALNILGAE